MEINNYQGVCMSGNLGKVSEVYIYFSVLGFHVSLSNTISRVKARLDFYQITTDHFTLHLDLKYVVPNIYFILF